MKKITKLIARISSRPKDFNWDEMKIVLKRLGFKEIQGKGSRVKFYHRENDCLIHLREPHPVKILKPYIIREVLEILKAEKLI